MNFVEEILPDESVDINITPLIDIVFLLLIFFMISTTFAESHAIKVKLPAAGTSTVESSVKDITVSIKEDGGVFFEDKEISIPVLKQKMEDGLKSNPKIALIVRADKKVEHGKVVGVLDIAKRTGIQKIAVATTPKK